jgi:hypothetical protein
MLTNGSGNGRALGINRGANQPFARLPRINGMDRLGLSLEEIGSSSTPNPSLWEIDHG